MVSISIKEAIIELVNQVPPGYVVSFGQLAPLVSEMTDKNVTAQVVGRQLSGMPEHERILLPRRRVVNKEGYISAMKLGRKGWKQRKLLLKDGVELDHNTVKDIESVRWKFE